MPSELTGVALVTGGGRGIGADVARELTRAGMRVAVSARTRAQVEAVAQEIGGLAIEADVSKQADVERMVEQTERELGPIDLLVANAGIALWEERAWEVPVEDWWRVQEVNVLGVYLTCRAAIPGNARARERTDRDHGQRRGLSARRRSRRRTARARRPPCASARRSRTSSTAASRSSRSARASSRRSCSPDRMPDNAPWTPPECAPRLVRALASGKFDRLSGRYLHAEHDPPEELEARIEQILADDLNAIRLRR